MATSGESQDGQIFGFGNDRGDKPRGHASPDGTETIPAYECAPGCPVAELDEQSGERVSGSRAEGDYGRLGYMGWDKGPMPAVDGDRGGASRFFYVAKSSRSERNAGLDGFEEREQPWLHDDGRAKPKPLSDPRMDREQERRPTKNGHPTVKPIDLMRWLVRLVTPPGGTVLDPFVGSGTTGVACALEGFDFVGIEREAEYVSIAEARIAWWEQQSGDTAEILIRAGLSERLEREHREAGQMTLEGSKDE